MKAQSENVRIMSLETRIDLLRERLDDAEDGGLPDKAGIRQELAMAENELAQLKSPFATGQAA